MLALMAKYSGKSLRILLSSFTEVWASSVPPKGFRLGTSAAVNSSRQRVPWWASRKAKAWAGTLAACGAAIGGAASIQYIADFLNDFFRLGWFSGATRTAAIILAFVAAIWIVSANQKEKDEIEVLRAALAKAEAQGLSHAAAEFRVAVKSIVAFNVSGWTPENVTRFQSDALQFGKSLFDYLGIPEARVCLYEPGAVDTAPEETGGATITSLNYVWATPVPGRHDPSHTIPRSPATQHMFQALKDKKPQHTKKRKGSRASENLSKRWNSSICMGIKAGSEPFALLTVDSTAERAFDNAAEGVLTLLGDLLAFAEIEKDRAREARLAQQASNTLVSTHRR
jgi:hypothetical protein